jgi:predicted nucleic acid-binding protein
MSNSFVLDCSVTMAWCFQDETNEYTEAVLESLETSNAVVPSLWQLEVSNVLLMAQKRKRITDNGIFHFLSLLEELPIVIVPSELTMKDTILLSQKYQLTAYDASYLNMCLYHDIPMATLDKKLEKAALSSGSSIFQP